MSQKKIIRIYVITDNCYLYHGIRELIQDSRVFEKFIYHVEQTIRLPSVVFYNKYHTHDIIIIDNYLHCHAISKYRPENTLVLPSNYDLDKYIECFNTMSNPNVDINKFYLKKLSSQETLILSLFSDGNSDDKISVMLNITKKNNKFAQAKYIAKAQSKK